jgi:hypothetical protein
MARARKLAAATVLCALAAGCGGSSGTTAAFKASYVKASEPIERIGNDVAGAVEGASRRSFAQVANEFAGLADRLDTELIELESLKPPASIARAFATVTAAANRFEDDLRAISYGASKNDAAAAGTATKALLADAATLNSAAATIRQKLGIR